MNTVIIDLEATCCDRGTIPRDEMEIIEIGAVFLTGPEAEIAAEFQTFVKPTRHPGLTTFCTGLTSISQQDVDSAPGYPDALSAFLAWCSPLNDPEIASWGAYDMQQLEQDCTYHEVPPPGFRRHRNLKEEYLTGNLVGGLDPIGMLVRRPCPLGFPFLGSAPIRAAAPRLLIPSWIVVFQIADQTDPWDVENAGKE